MRPVRSATIALLLAAAAAGEPGPTRPLDLGALGAPAFTTFSVRDGLPDSAVMALATDAEGFVWGSSALGLTRYDGRRWQAVEVPGASGRADSLHLDRAGTLWAALQAGGLARHDRSGWSLEARGLGLTTDHLFRFVEVDGAAGPDSWVLTVDAGLFRRVGGRWQPDPGNPQLPVGRIHAIARTREVGGHERLWAASINDGLWWRETGGAWQRFRAPGFDAGQVDDLVTTRHEGREELWIATYGHGLYRLTASGLEPVAAEGAGLETRILYNLQASVAPSGARTLWAATRGGVLRVQGDREVTLFDRRHGLPSNAVRFVHLWRSPGGSDVLWVATESGVARAVLGGNPWRTASLLGAKSNGVFGVRVESDGRGGERLWVAAAGDGIGLYERGRWRTFSTADGSLPDDNPRLLVRVPEVAGGPPVLYTSVVPGELMRWQGGSRFERVATPWPKDSSQHVMDLVARTDAPNRHELWAATRASGIYRLRDGVWTAFRAPTATSPWRVIRIVEQVDAAGRSWLWASTNQGLARFDGTGWSLLGRQQGLPETDLLGVSLIPDRSGRPVLWAGSYRDGLFRVDVADPLAPRLLPGAELPPPPVSTVYSALADSRGRIYVCTDAGVQRLTPRAEGGFEERVFGRRDGLVHEECNTNAQFIDAHDRYWAGTLAGLSVHEPATVDVDRQPKPLHLIRVSADGQDLDPAALRIPSRTRELRFEVALLSWQREDESRFRWQLDGYDPQPGDWSAESDQVYGMLPPGEYRLRVEAHDYAGLASLPIEVSLEVVPAWWERGSVRGAAVVLLTLAAVAFYRQRVRRLSRETGELAREVAARTAELAAANERLAQLSREDPLTGVGNRRVLDEVVDAEWRRAARLRTPLGFLMLDIDCFKDYNDHLGHVAGDACLKQVAATITAAHARAGELVARYGGEEFAVLVPGMSPERLQASAEHVRRAVVDLALPHPASSVGPWVTVSVGVAWLLPALGGEPGQLVGQADRALYRAKHEGRNRVCLAPGADPVRVRQDAMADEEFLAAFEAVTLEAFGHRDHVRMAWLMLRALGPERAPAAIRDGIRRFALARGATGLYHETLTRFWIESCRAADPLADASFEAFVTRAPHLLDKDLWTKHWSRERLFADDARSVWVEPDLASLPG